jgi:general secretion pathway protein K
LASRFARLAPLRRDDAAGTADAISERGVALLTVLWVLALLSVIAAGLVSQTHAELQIARNMKETAQARALAEGGVFLAIPHLLDPSLETKWQPDGQERIVEYGGGTIRIALQDEAGRIDLNAAPDELLAGLFAVLGVGSEETTRLVDAIADWKDSGDLHRLNGAKRDDYRRAGLPWVPRNGPFEAVEELRLVLGMTPALYARALPLVTIYSQNARVNPATASAEVLQALPGARPAEIARFVQARDRAEAERAQTGRVLAPLPPMTGLEQFLAPGPSRVVTIRSEGQTPGGGLFVREAVVDMTGKADNPYVFLAWRKGRGRETADDNISAGAF